MWLFLPIGFLSVVAVRDDHDAVLARARDRRVIDYLVRRLAELGRPDGEPFVDPDADYPFRVVLDRASWAAFLEREGLEVAALNFKAAAEQVLGPSHPYVHALHQVWRLLWDQLAHLRPEPPRTRRRA